MDEINNRRIKVTKRMLKESLIEMTRTKSIHQISIRELCEKADINRSTFYKHYGSQYDLLKEMEDEVLAQIEKDMVVDRKNGMDDKYLISTLTFLSKNIELCQMLINSNVDPEFPQKLLYLPSIKKLLQEILPEKSNPNEAAYTYEFMVHGGYNMLKRWINQENRETPEQMSTILCHVFDCLVLNKEG